MQNDPKTTTPKKRARKRRGSVILLAIATLAIIAIAGLSYMTVVSIDRSSSGAYANQTNFRQQVTGVTQHIGALLTADLFGNKIVSTSTPRYPSDSSGATSASYWPKMFEDGETWDAPTTATKANGEFLYFDPRIGGMQDSARLQYRTNGIRGRFEAAVPDDAWLASTEPEDWDGDGLIDGYRQISNLRMAYTLGDLDFDGDIDATDGDEWIRGDGHFVDLAEWFFQEEDFRANPGAELWDFTDVEIRSRDSRFGLVNLGEASIGPEQGINQETHTLQMDQMFIVGAADEPSDEDSQLNHVDVRRWADTDGDTFPDARWQQLDALGDLFGQRWFVAARIIDNSALVNVNTAIDIGIDPISGAMDPGNGMTPADVDFRRLLRNATDLNLSSPDVNLPPNVSRSSMAEHLARGLQTTSVLTRINDSLAPQAERLNRRMVENWQATFANLDYGDQPSSGQREAMWRFFGSDPFRPSIGAGTAYPLTDELDLRAYWGFNNNVALSKIEQRLDGPEESTSLANPRFLPGFEPAYPTSADCLGVMRSKEDPANVRRFGRQDEVDLPGRPNARYRLDDRRERVQKDLRRRLTTVSGAGQFAPVPPLNTAPAYANQFVNLKVRLDETELGSTTPRVKSEAVRRSFEYLMWALAPFASNEPYFLNEQVGWTGLAPTWPLTSNYHYGGGGSTTPTVLNGGMTLQNAEYALFRAASLAVNLADAVDEDDTPSVARFFNNGNDEFRRALGPLNETILSGSMSHGDIQPLALGSVTPPEGGSEVTQVGGLAFVGMDRQPFLREVHSVAVYRDTAMDATFPDAGLFDEEIDPSNTDENFYGLLAVEIGNPWPEAIEITNYTVRIGTDAEYFTFGIPNTVLLPGAYAVYYFDQGADTSDTNGGVAELIRDSWLNNLQPGGVSDNFTVFEPLEYVGVAGVTDLSDAGRRRVFFHELFDDEPSSAYLFAEGNGLPAPVLVDRMSNPETSRGANAREHFPAGLLDSERVNIQLTPPPPPPDDDPRWTGYTAYTSSLTRPTRTLKEGFPPYVLELDQLNRNTFYFFDEATALPGDTVDLLINRAVPIPDESLDEAVVFDEFFARMRLDSDIPIGLPAKPASDTAFSALGPSGYPDFQFFVPNGPLAAPSEVGLVSAFAHVCRGSQYQDVASWTTVGEQLGSSTEWFLNGISGAVNPYFGVLDTSRYIINGDYLGGNDLNDVVEAPDYMRVPLATRVFDCFEALAPPSDLVHGRVNINTATLDTLRLLPHASPEVTFLPLVAPADSPISNPLTPDRAHFIELYREGKQFGSLSESTANRELLTSIAKLRNSPRFNVNGGKPNRAIASTGELTLLAEWDTADGGGTGLPAPGVSSASPFRQLNFQEGGLDSNLNAQASWFDIRPNSSEDADWWADPNSYDPDNDQEERLAFYRMVSNIVSTRSDVFTAWFVIRAYDPEAVEAIEVLTTPNSEDLRDLFEDLRPSFETRWIAVFDRSGVRKPTDRPRILLLAELPPT